MSHSSASEGASLSARERADTQEREVPSNQITRRNLEEVQSTRSGRKQWKPGRLSALQANRLSAFQALWEEGSNSSRDFTEDLLQITTREAKSKYDLEAFRRWKRAKKKAEKASK